MADFKLTKLLVVLLTLSSIMIIPVMGSTAQEWGNKGLALYESGNYEEAIVAFDKALAIDPNLASAWNNKGLALYESGSYGKAITAYEIGRASCRERV